MCRGQYLKLFSDLVPKNNDLNKATKIQLNYFIGGIIMLVLLWVIYRQVQQQLFQYDFKTIFRNGNTSFLIGALLLMPINATLEIFKWKLLANSAQPISFYTAAKSYLAGLALSILTPNRIGEYPGRIIYLKRKNTPRLISVTFLGMFTQFLTLFVFGLIGLLYYNFSFPGYWQKIVLFLTLVVTVFVSLLFYYFEKWSAFIERFSIFKRLKVYNVLLKRFTHQEQFSILGISMLRFCIYVSQYLLLMHWVNIKLPIVEGFFTACLFFFGMAVIPSIALTEMGVRGGLSLWLFQNVTPEKIGILIATLSLWFINLIIPAIIGSVLWIKMRLIK